MGFTALFHPYQPSPSITFQCTLKNPSQNKSEANKYFSFTGKLFLQQTSTEYFLTIHIGNNAEPPEIT